MPSCSRRGVLAAVGALVGGLAGCQNTGDGTPTDSTTATSTRTTTAETTTATGTTTETTETTTGRQLQCLPESRPDGWPLATRAASHDSYVADAPTIEAAPSASWSADATVPSDVEAFDATFGQPVVAGDRVYAVTRVQVGPERADPGGHTLQARDRSTGELRWSVRLPQRPSAPAVRGEGVLVRSGGEVYAFDRRDGDERWTRTLDVAGRVVPTADRIYAWGGTLSALAPDGTAVWDRSFDEHVVVPPAVGPAGVYVGLLGGTVVALDPATGRTLWTAETPRGDDESGSLSPLVSTVVATDCHVFVVTDGDVFAFDPAGEFRWHAEGYAFDLATDGTTLYARDRKPDPFRTVLRARDAGTGELRWEKRYEVASMAHGVLTDSALYVPTNGGLLALAPDDGRTLWDRSRSVRSLALADGTLFGTRAEDGALVAVA